MRKKIKIFSDGASIKSFLRLNKNNLIKGFTTNPSLMRKEGIKNYNSFAKKVLNEVKNKPVSFEVFSDDLSLMEKEALEIGKWAKNVYVKIPITNSKGKSTYKVIQKLNDNRINVNITAIFTIKQVKYLIKKLNIKSKNILSVFAGRIADTGTDPKKIVKEIVKITKNKKKIEVLWASVREVYNIKEAGECGCHIVTVPTNMLSKIKNFGRNLEEFSLITVKQFAEDAKKAKFRII